MFNFWATLRGQRHLDDLPVATYDDNLVEMYSAFLRNFYEMMVQPNSQLYGRKENVAHQDKTKDIEKKIKTTQPEICSPRMLIPIGGDSINVDERRYKNMLTQMKCFIEMQLESLDQLSKQSYPPNKNQVQTEEPQKQNHIEQTIMNLVQRIEALEKQNDTKEYKKETDKLTKDNVELLNKRACQQEPKTGREPNSKCSQNLKMEQVKLIQTDLVALGNKCNVPELWYEPKKIQLIRYKANRSQGNKDAPAQKIENKIEHKQCPNYKPSNQRLTEKLALAAKKYNETCRRKDACQEHSNVKPFASDPTALCNWSVRSGLSSGHVQRTLPKYTQSEINLREMSKLEMK